MVLRGGQDLNNIWDALSAANLRPEQAMGVRVVDGLIHLPLIPPVKAAGRSFADIEEDARKAYGILAPGIGLTLAPGPAADRGDLGFTGAILPDGTLTLPLIGPVAAAGYTAADLSHRLVAIYKTAIPTINPRVDVLVVQGDQDVATVWAALVAANQRAEQAAEVTVRDGRIHLPLIPPMAAEHRTLEVVQAAATAAYRKLAPGIAVTLSPARQRDRSFAVLGEVKVPGRFQTVRRLPVLAAIAQAGGFSDRANFAQVVVATPRGDGVIDIQVVDLEGGVAGQDGGGLLQVTAGSIIYVPRSKIADLNKFVQEYIRNMLPIGVNYSMSEPVNYIPGKP